MRGCYREARRTWEVDVAQSSGIVQVVVMAPYGPEDKTREKAAGCCSASTAKLRFDVFGRRSTPATAKISWRNKIGEEKLERIIHWKSNIKTGAERYIPRSR